MERRTETLSVATVINLFQRRPEVAPAASKGAEKLTKRPCNRVFAPQRDSLAGFSLPPRLCSDPMKPRLLLEAVFVVVWMSGADPLVFAHRSKPQCEHLNPHTLNPIQRAGRRTRTSMCDLTGPRAPLWPQAGLLDWCATMSFQNHLFQNLLTVPNLSQLHVRNMPHWHPEHKRSVKAWQVSQLSARLSNPRSPPPPAGQLGSLKDFSNASLLLILLCW